MTVNLDTVIAHLRKWDARVTPSVIRRIRARHKLDAATFAARLGVSLRRLESWESGKTRPRGPALRCLTILWKGFHPKTNRHELDLLMKMLAGPSAFRTPPAR